MEILYLAHNRLEFTKASLAALFENTNWDFVDRLIVYDDASVDGTRGYLQSISYPIDNAELICGTFGGPVEVTNHFLSRRDPTDDHVFCKLDSDVMLPPGWLDQSLRVMRQNPELHLLGIEAFNPVATGCTERSYTQARHIGGIGLMRSGAFVTLPRPHGRFGFTAWQEHTDPRPNCGWINPSLPVFLLDWLPREPWRSLSDEYIAQGWQRRWDKYQESRSELWKWWID